jgi:hypothetical protein
MLLWLARWAENTEFFSYIRASAYTYPVILSLHMVAIALFGAMILLTDLRLLGLAMRSCSVSDVVDQLRVPKRIGFVFAATCGILLLGSKAEDYYYNIFFRIKLTLFMLVIVHALVFRRTVYNRAAEFDRNPHIPGRARLAALLSLILWVGIFSAGRGIGFILAQGGLHYGVP